MKILPKFRRAPLRIVSGGYILNSGMVKFTSTDEDEAKAVHSMAAGAYPFLERVKPRTFQKALGAGEIALGGALLLPVFSPRVAGAGLVAFSGGLLGLYWRTPGMHIEGSIRPTPQGVALAKDSWLLGIGAALVLDSLGESAKDLRKKSEPAKADAKAALTAGAATAAGAMTTALGAVGTALHEAQVAAAQKAPEVKETLVHAGSVAADKAAEFGAVAADKASDLGAVAAEKASDLGAVAAEKASEFGAVAADKAAQATDVVSSKASELTSAAAEKAPSRKQIAKEYDAAKKSAQKSAKKQRKALAKKVDSLTS